MRCSNVAALDFAEMILDIGDDIVVKEISFVELLRYYQFLQLEVNEFREVVEVTRKFIDLLDGEHGAFLMPNPKDVSNLKDRISKLERRKLERQYLDLRYYLNAGNLRHVVFTLYIEEGLTAREFGEKIGFAEEDITSLTKEGVVPFNLLKAICKYFGIIMTEEYTRYINI